MLTILDFCCAIDHNNSRSCHVSGPQSPHCPNLHVVQVHAKTMQQVQHLKLQWNMMESRKKQLHLAGRAGAAAGRPRSASHENVAMTQAQEMMMRHTLNEGGPPHTNIVDPFLAGELSLCGVETYSIWTFWKATITAFHKEMAKVLVAVFSVLYAC